MMETKIQFLSDHAVIQQNASRIAVTCPEEMNASLRFILLSPTFQNWITHMDENISLEMIQIQTVDFNGVVDSRWMRNHTVWEIFALFRQFPTLKEKLAGSEDLLQTFENEDRVNEKLHHFMKQLNPGESLAWLIPHVQMALEATIPHVQFIKLVVQGLKHYQTTHFQHPETIHQTCFLQEDFSAVLVVLKTRPKHYAVVVKRPNVAAGIHDFQEIPTFSFKPDGTICSPSLLQIQEQLGISVDHAKMKELTAPMAFSAHGCGGKINMLFIDIEVNHEFVIQQQTLERTRTSDGNLFHAQIIPFQDLFQTRDLKTVAAAGIYLEKSKLDSTPVSGMIRF